jgi:hypothetical protein
VTGYERHRRDDTDQTAEPGVHFIELLQ